MPKISIVVPVYQIEQYIEECIDSIIHQTFSDLEIILVDDGSKDRSGEICDAYVKKDGRITVIHQKNMGLSCARNAGKSIAKGEFICFCDGDDLLSPTYCETLLSLLEGTTCDYSACGVCRFTDGEEPRPMSSELEPIMMSHLDYLKAQLNKEREFGVWNRLYRRELFETLQFSPGRIHEDVIFSADLCNCKGNVILTDEQLYCYRQRDSGIVAEGSLRCSPDRIFAGEYLMDTARRLCPEIYEQCLVYAIEYPWMFVDRIYVKRQFRDNKLFLKQIKLFLQKYNADINHIDSLEPLIKKRMRLYAKSRFLYGINAYARLFRAYLFHILGKDAYSDGHGI